MKTDVSPPRKRGAARKLAPLLLGGLQRFRALAGRRAEIKESHDYAQAIVETAGPQLLLDAELRVKTANEAFYKHFHVSQAQIENCPVFEIGNGQFNIDRK